MNELGVTGDPRVAYRTQLYRIGRRLELSVLVKASFELQRGRPVHLTAPDAIVVEDLYQGQHLLKASELAPYRAKADVVVWAHAHPPRGARPATMTLRFALGRGPQTLIDKRRALDSSSFGTVAGLGPIAPHWPPRASKLDATLRQQLAEGSALVELPSQLDWSYFQVAPADQQVPYLHGDEWLLLDGMHPSLWRIHTQLCGARAEARLIRRGEAASSGHPLTLIADGLHIDVDAMRCTITWRGRHSMTRPEQLAESWLAVGLAEAERGADFSSLEEPASDTDDSTEVIDVSAILPPSEALPWERPGEQHPAAQATPEPASEPLPWERPGEESIVGAAPSRAPMRDETAPMPTQAGGTVTIGAELLRRTMNTLPWDDDAAPKPVTNAPSPVATERREHWPAPPARLDGKEDDDGTASLNLQAIPWVEAPYALSGASQPGQEPDGPALAMPGAPWEKGAAPLLTPEAYGDATKPVDSSYVLALMAQQESQSAGIIAAADQVIPARRGDGVPIVNQTLLSVCSLAWQLRPPQSSLTLIAKGSFTIVPDKPVQMVEAEPPCGPRHISDDENASIRYASDFAIFKARADVTAVGHAYASSNVANTGEVRFAFGHDAAPADPSEPSERPLNNRRFERRIAVFGDRSWPPGSPPEALRAANFEHLSLCYERAYGGPGYAANPVGMGYAAELEEQLVALPNFVEITTPPDTGNSKTEADMLRPACFAPLPLPWRMQALEGGAYDEDWLRDRWPYFPDEFDYQVFQAAPARQRLAYLRGDEPFAFDGMHAEHPALRGELGGRRTRCFAQRTAEAGGEFFEIEARLDTVAFDLDAMRVDLVWRAVFDVADDIASDIASVYFVCEPIEEEGFSLEQARSRHQIALVELDMVPDSPDGQPAVANDAGVVAPPLPAIVPTADDRPAALPLPPTAETTPIRHLVAERLAKGASLAGLDLVGADLSAMDFSGAILKGAILKGANLIDSTFDGADLDGAQLSGVDARRARFKGAKMNLVDLTRAQLEGANLSGAELDGAVLAQVEASDAIFRQARGAKASFEGGVFHRARFDQAEFPAADFCAATLEGASFEGAALPHASLFDAAGSAVNFTSATLPDARLEGAQFPNGIFWGIDAPGSVWEAAQLRSGNFERAKLSDASFVRAACQGASFASSVLREARFKRAHLADANLRHADLMCASLERADLKRADLSGANLYAVETHGAQFSGAKLEDAIVAKTRIEGAL